MRYCLKCLVVGATMWTTTTLGVVAVYAEATGWNSVPGISFWGAGIAIGCFCLVGDAFWCLIDKLPGEK